MSIAKTEAALEATRKKISEQLSMVGRSIQSIDPTLYDKERVLERVVTKRRNRPYELDTPMELKELEAALEPDEPMSINKWRGILQELAQRCPPDRWADDHQEGPSPDTFECGYCCALMQLHAMAGLEGHCIPIDEFPMPMRAIAMPQVEFKEAIYELAFGDNAINRGFSEGEVIATIKGFAHDSWVAEEFDHEPSHSAREHWNANKAEQEEDGLIKATYYGNTPENCRHIIRSYLEYSQFGKLIEEHPNNYKALEPFEGWWNDYISDGEDEFVEQDNG